MRSYTYEGAVLSYVIFFERVSVEDKMSRGCNFASKTREPEKTNVYINYYRFGNTRISVSLDFIDRSLSSALRFFFWHSNCSVVLLIAIILTFLIIKITITRYNLIWVARVIITNISLFVSDKLFRPWGRSLFVSFDGGRGGCLLRGAKTNLIEQPSPRVTSYTASREET